MFLHESGVRPRSLPALALHALFFVSGMCGLVYEVVWVRQLGIVFGNTVYSASLVTAVFMGGLGVGSYVAGDWVDRRAPSAAVRAYGVAEVVIGLAAAGLACLLPHLAPLAAHLTSYAKDPHGWFEPTAGSLALRYAFATILLLVPTVAMGATFTLLVRHALCAGAQDAGWKVGLLYGANTAGAALGAYLTDFALVPRFGLLRTELATAAAQVIVGVVALAFSTGGSAGVAPTTARPPRARLPRSAVAACIALFLSGFAALGMELVWFRGLASALGAYRPVFSIILALILSGIWGGSVVGGWAHKRWGRPVELFLVSQGLFVLSALGFVASFSSYDGTPYHVAFRTAAWVVLVPALFMGFSMPLAQASAQDAAAHAGHRAGALYLANTFGSVAGSLFAGFVLAPWVGTQTSYVIMAACAAVAPVPLVLAAEPRTRSMLRAVGASATLSVPAMLAWLALPPTYLLSRFLPALPEDDRPIELKEGVNEVIVVTNVPDGSKRLITNGHPMSSTNVLAQRYMRAFSHVPLLMMEDPKSALVICFGVGSTLNAASLHASVTRLDLADLSKNVLEHAPFFRESNHDVLADPRLHVYVNDGRQHLAMQPPGTYDLITLEPPPVAFAGVSALYSEDFYELAKSRLTDRGLMTQWLPAYQATPDKLLAMVKAFVDAFPQSALLSGYGAELILIGARGPGLVFDLDRVERNLAREPQVAEDLRRVHLGTLTELVGTFAGNAETLRRATFGVPPLTDDRPVLEYDVPGQTTLLPTSLFDLSTLASFCPACFHDGHPDPRVAWLDDYQEALRRLYATEAYRRIGSHVAIDSSGAVREAIHRSSYLHAMLTGQDMLDRARDRAAEHPDDPNAHLGLAYALSLAGSFADAVAEQRRGLTQVGDDPEAHYNLATLLLSVGQRDEALAEAQRVLSWKPDHAGANAMVCDALGPKDPRGAAACARKPAGGS